jgi:hypothetical protein
MAPAAEVRLGGRRIGGRAAKKLDIGRIVDGEGWQPFLICLANYGVSRYSD